MSQLYIFDAAGNSVPVGPDNPVPTSGGGAGGGMEPADITGDAPITVADNGDGTATVGVTVGTSSASVASGDHGHSIASVSGLQSALDGKSDTSHAHTIDSTTGTLAVNRGGTGATSASGARGNLGLDLTVPQGAIADLEAAPTMEDYNALLAALRSAGILSA